MRGTLKIAKIFGIPVLLHWSFILLFGIGLYYGRNLGLSKQELGWWALFSIAVFTCILFHEFGHALMAKRFGVETKDIILFPIGGMARLNRLPDKPIQELIVAIAGPLVNILIAIVLFPFFWFLTRPFLGFHETPSFENIDDTFFLFLPLLLFLNLLLAVFNLIPAFPMDGGRILRALLSIKWGRVKATKVAVLIGQIIALSLIVYSLWAGRYSYMFVGLFVAFTGMREYRWTKMENLLASHIVEKVYLRQPITLSIRDNLQHAIDSFKKTGQQGFIVTEEQGIIAGTLDIGEIMRKEILPAGLVEDFYKIGFAAIPPTASLKEAIETLQQKDQEILAVIEEGSLVGVLEEEMIWEFLANAPDI